MREYKLLDKTDLENLEVIREYAEARTELKALELRSDFLQELIDENDGLRGSVWTTQGGKCIAISDLDDDHLKNIIIHLRERGAYNARIVKEYQKRFKEMPELPEAEMPF